MKTNSIILLLLVADFLNAQNTLSFFEETKINPIHHILLKDDALNSFLLELNTDSIIQTEILASYFFYQKINEYRKKNNVAELSWSNKLWMAARNHCVYMAFSKYDHIESKGLMYFTGTTPSKRIGYVDAKWQNKYMTGENMLMNYSAYFRRSLINNAKNIAEASFEQWKASPEHNENMLSKDYTTEGTAFYIVDNDSKVFATTNFSNEAEDNNALDAVWMALPDKYLK